jgi:glycosyltransferase involved in cell wall biosynthesis
VRIGIHAPYLGTLGGGEKYALRILDEAVASGAEVLLLSPDAPAPDAWKHLNVDIASDAFTWIPTADDEAASQASRELDVFVTVHNDVPPLSHARRSVAVLQFPFRGLGWSSLEDVLHPIAGRRRRREAPRRFQSYDLFLCYSQFVRRHLAARWNLEAQVLYPPVDLPSDPAAPGSRRPHVVGVGRFFRSGNNKRHDMLIRAFSRLWRESAQPGDWQLHLAGALHEVEGPYYIDRLRRLAEGLPVTFHVDAPLSTVVDLYTHSSMFWHAAGIGESERRHPERMEHFGITTVEAMARGCVVAVAAGGGQLELVRDGEDGFFWNDVDELVRLSRPVLTEPDAFDPIRERAIESARRFSTERFRAEVRRTILEGAGGRAA